MKKQSERKQTDEINTKFQALYKAKLLRGKHPAGRQANNKYQMTNKFQLSENLKSKTKSFWGLLTKLLRGVRLRQTTKQSYKLPFKQEIATLPSVARDDK